MTYDKIHDLFKKGYDQKSWKQFLGETFAKARLLARPEDLIGIESNVAKKALKLGHLLLDENGIERQIAVYEVTLGKGIVLERNRVGLRNLLRKHWKDIDAAFIVYHNPDNNKWRFTYVSELTGYDADGEFVKIKTEPKRYTYVLGEGESTRTAAERFALIAKKGSNATLEDVKDAFSVEKLSKEFFSEYKKHYDVICSFMLKKPGIKQTIFKRDEKEIRDFSKKLLGRIVFLYFIQKKGWLGVPKKGKWGDGDLQFMSNLFNKQKSKDLFYSQTLSKLFFDTLNTKRKDDLTELVKDESYRIPYLNGGLFEEENKNHRNIIFDSGIFEDLFNFFNQYNFTIYEDDPNDHTIAVDPEMLGHIFENLLEDNKDKGAYYTPKEIVHYMCQESLIEYLTTWFENKGYDVGGFITFTNPGQPGMFPVNEKKKGQTVLEMPVNEKKIDRALIEKLLKKKLDEEDRQMVKEHSKEFHEALDCAKICDPAIGSGAFPMGLLQEIFTAKQTLHFFKHGSLVNFPASEVKLNIIQNSIYGVDIEKGAVDIARLRFWLSLVVDEDEPKPLPNLDYKIVVGNSLVSKLGDEIIDIDWNIDTTEGGFFVQQRAEEVKDILDKIFAEQKEFFNPDCDKMKLAKEIRDLKIKLLISQLELMVAKADKEKAPKRTDYKDNKNFVKAHELYMQTIGWKEIIRQLKELSKKHNESLHFFDWKLDFPEVMNEQVAKEVGFDIVIGNPPYLRIQGIREVDNNYADLLAEKFASSTGSFDLYVLFAERGLLLANDRGLMNFIMPVKWVNSAFGKGLRSFIKRKKAAFKIISFEAFQVFNASTYTGLHWFKNNTNRLQYCQLDRDLPDNRSLETFLYTLSEEKFNLYEIDSLNDDAWTLTDNRASQILKSIKNQPLRVKDIFEKIFQGIASSKDSVYFLTDCKLQRKYIRGFSKELDKYVEVERDFVKPLLKGDQVHRYEKLYTRNYVIFPYKLENGKAILYSEREIRTFFPKSYTYLKENELVLKGRENNRLKNDDNWFRYIYPKNLTLFAKPKLICPYLAHRSQFSQDVTGEFYINTKCFGLLRKKEINLDHLFLLGILNSELMWFFIQNTGTVFRGGYFAYTPDYLNSFAIPNANAIQQKSIISLVTKILSQKSNGKDTSKLEQQIDNIVYRLYELTYEEVKVIDPEFGLTKSEYEGIKID